MNIKYRICAGPYFDNCHVFVFILVFITFFSRPERDCLPFLLLLLGLDIFCDPALLCLSRPELLVNFEVIFWIFSFIREASFLLWLRFLLSFFAFWLKQMDRITLYALYGKVNIGKNLLKTFGSA